MRPLGLGIVATALGATPCGLGCSDRDSSSTNVESGSAGAPSTYDPSAVPAAESYFSQLAAAYCHNIFTCPPLPDDDLLFIPPLAGTEENCTRYFLGVLEQNPSTRDAELKLAGGALVFQADHAQDCLSSVALCGRSPQDAGACVDVFEGNIELGGACQRDEDCAGNAYCLTDRQCPGQCAARLPVGSSCMRAAQCDQSGGTALCGVSGDDWVCALVAVGTAAAGEPCVIRSGVASEICAPGLWCDVTQNGSGTCAEPIVAGGACDDLSDVCRDHLVCLLDDTGLGVCGPITLVETVGSACTRQISPPYRFCDPSRNLYCDNSVCIELGNGSLGSRCAPGESFEGLCGEGLYCGGDETAPTCVAQLEPGAVCGNSRACTYGCDDSSNTCARQYCQAT